MRTETQKIKNISPAERRRRMQWTGFIIFNSAILLGAAALMPYRALADGALKNFIFCFWNRYLHIYCPTCGVTRMLDSLLHLRFADTARENICMLVFVFAVAYFDLRAFIALLRREDRIFKVRLVHMWIFIAFLLIHAVVRNILLIKYGIDPLGDNRAFWGWS